jgi:hypothetical protein
LPKTLDKVPFWVGVQLTLTRLNPSKAGGPDRIPNWLLKDYSEFLAFPITKIINLMHLSKSNGFLLFGRYLTYHPCPKLSRWQIWRKINKTHFTNRMFVEDHWIIYCMWLCKTCCS